MITVYVFYIPNSNSDTYLLYFFGGCFCVLYRISFALHVVILLLCFILFYFHCDCECLCVLIIIIII